MTTPPSPQTIFSLNNREDLPRGASPMRCPTGGFHEWRYFKDSEGGISWYECTCGTRLEKYTLKRLTDRPFYNGQPNVLRDQKAP